MIQTYFLLKKQIEKLNNTVNDIAYIQKIYSTSWFLCLNVRVPGKTIHLFLGRGKGYEGLWIGNDVPKSSLRKIDKFLEYVRRHLSGSTLNGIEIDKNDRAIKLRYQKWGRENSFYIFYRGRKLYFMNYFYNAQKNQMQSFKSWDQKLGESVSFDDFDEVGRKQLSHQEESSENIEEIEHILVLEEKAAFKDDKKKTKKFINRKLQRIENDLCRVKARGELLLLINENEDLSKLPMKVKTTSHKISFKEKSHFKRRDEIYTKVKKLKKAEGILESRLKLTRDQSKLNFVESKVNNLETISPVWESKSKNSQSLKQFNSDDYLEYKSSKIHLYLGLTSQGNDYIRKKFGTKDDIWVHLDKETSAHVIIKKRNDKVSIEELTIAASAIIDKTKKTIEQADIVYTQLKNIKGVKGAAGMVTFKKEKRLRVEYLKGWNEE